MSSSDNNTSHDIALNPSSSALSSSNIDTTDPAVTSFLFSTAFLQNQPRHLSSSATTPSNADHLLSYPTSSYPATASGNAPSQPLFPFPTSSMTTAASSSQQIFPTSFNSISNSATNQSQNNNVSLLTGGEAQVPKTVVIDNLLEKVMRTTQDARDAFAQSRSQDGIQRLAELKAVIDLVVSFVNPLSSSKPSPPGLKSSPSFTDSHSYFQPSSQRVSPTGVKKTSSSSSRKSSLSGSVAPLIPSPEDASRKRCASPQTDRVVKSLKLEPKEEPPSLIATVTTAFGGSNVSVPSIPSSSSVNLPSVPSSSSLLSMSSALSSVNPQTAIPPQLIHSKTYPPPSSSLHAHALTSHPRLTSRPSMESLASSLGGVGTSVGQVPNAAMAHQLNFMQQQQQHHPISLGHTHSLSTSHIPTVHSPLVPSLHSNNGGQSGLTNNQQGQSGTESTSNGWDDSAMLQQSMVPSSATAGSSSSSALSPLALQHTQSRYHSGLSTGLSLNAAGAVTRPTRSASYSGAFTFSSFDLTPSGSTTSKSTPTNEDNMATNGGIESAAGAVVDAPPPPPSAANSSSPDYPSDREDSPGRLLTTSASSATIGSSAATGRATDSFITTHQNNEISPELKAEVDRIFFEFMNVTCSDLDAKDVKGEPIHQPLMAKKMQRLDESRDFRPFKFRIQAFTNGFLEELARQGLSEDIIPMKKVRHYLWTNPYISRFNEDGKKAKSKGNHIWNIDARKAEEGGWQFRPFRRKIAGTFPNVAYVGIGWQFRPRVWDPQASRSNLQVRFASPNLPSWLSWNGDTLSGTPGPDAQSTEFTIEAKFSQEGKEMVLSQTYFLSVAPLTREGPTSYSTGPRRPSLVNDRRIPDAAVLTQSGSLLSTRTVTAPTSAPAALQDALTVVTEAIKAVSLEAHTVQGASPAEHLQIQNSLTRQEHVLTSTAQAINRVMIASASPPVVEHGDAKESRIVEATLARAGTEVVICAAQKVAADRSAAIQLTTGMTTSELDPPMVTMEEVSSTTKTAVAEAVEITDTTASPIDVMLTAETIIQQNTQPMTVSVAVPPMLTTGPGPPFSLTAHGVSSSYQPIDMSSFDYPMSDLSAPP